VARFSGALLEAAHTEGGIGGIDPISGEEFDPAGLSSKSQDHLVIPDQPWLDGINAGDGFIRQFVAVPLGEGLTVEAQRTGREVEGGLTLSLFEPRPGKFPDDGPRWGERMQVGRDLVTRGASGLLHCSHDRLPRASAFSRTGLPS